MAAYGTDRETAERAIARLNPKAKAPPAPGKVFTPVKVITDAEKPEQRIAIQAIADWKKFLILSQSFAGTSDYAGFLTESEKIKNLSHRANYEFGKVPMLQNLFADATGLITNHGGGLCST